MSNFNEGDIPKEIHDNKYRHCPTLRENYVFDPDFLLKTEGENIDPLKSIPIIRSYTATSRRLKSFNNWPEYVIKKPQDLAEAGFLSRNISDHVRCFYCGGCLRNWKSEDIPWIEHAKWFPQCHYLLLKKGKQFIDNVQRQKTIQFPVEAVNNISDQDMGILMELDIVKNVIAMGYPVSVIKYTLKNHIKQAGWPYLREEPFINDITKVQATNNGDSTDVSETSITLLSSRHTSSPPFSPISSVSNIVTPTCQAFIPEAKDNKYSIETLPKKIIEVMEIDESRKNESKELSNACVSSLQSRKKETKTLEQLPKKLKRNKRIEMSRLISYEKENLPTSKKIMKKDKIFHHKTPEQTFKGLKCNMKPDIYKGNFKNNKDRWKTFNYRQYSIDKWLIPMAGLYYSVFLTTDMVALTDLILKYLLD
nr:MAG: baculoviral IAP repeat-containing protein [Marsupenaeus japonicus endogenous nimavirus]